MQKKKLRKNTVSNTVSVCVFVWIKKTFCKITVQSSEIYQPISLALAFKLNWKIQMFFSFSSIFNFEYVTYYSVHNLSFLCSDSICMRPRYGNTQSDVNIWLIGLKTHLLYIYFFCIIIVVVGFRHAWTFQQTKRTNQKNVWINQN